MKKLLLLLVFTGLLTIGHTTQLTSAVKEAEVLICDSGNAVAYHAYECRGLKKCTHQIKRMKVSEAKAAGYRACKICY